MSLFFEPVQWHVRTSHWMLLIAYTFKANKKRHFVMQQTEQNQTMKFLTTEHLMLILVWIENSDTKLRFKGMC